MVFARKMAKIEWVCCDSCARWELFDNAAKDLGLDKYDVDKIRELVFMCRQYKFESNVLVRFDALEERMSNVEKRVQEERVCVNSCNDAIAALELDMVKGNGNLNCVVDDIEVRVDELEAKKNELQRKMDELTANRIESDVCLKMYKNNLLDLDKKLGEMSDRMLSKFKSEWPTPSEANEAINTKHQKEVESRNRVTRVSSGARPISSNYF